MHPVTGQKLIKEAMSRTSYNQTQIAEIAGVSQNSISDWINGKYDPGVFKAFCVISAIGLKGSEIVEAVESGESGKRKKPKRLKRL